MTTTEPRTEPLTTQDPGIHGEKVARSADGSSGGRWLVTCSKLDSGLCL